MSSPLIACDVGVGQNCLGRILNFFLILQAQQFLNLNRTPIGSREKKNSYTTAKVFFGLHNTSRQSSESQRTGFGHAAGLCGNSTHCARYTTAWHHCANLSVFICFKQRLLQMVSGGVLVCLCLVVQTLVLYRVHLHHKQTNKKNPQDL